MPDNSIDSKGGQPEKEPSTPEPSTPEPSTPEPSTPEPSTPEPSTSEPSTPELIKSKKTEAPSITKTEKKPASRSTTKKKAPARVPAKTPKKRKSSTEHISTESDPSPHPALANYADATPVSPSVLFTKRVSLLALPIAAIILAVIYIAFQFRGFSSAAAMDQAQIARHLAQGEGFSTDYIRPLALWQLEAAGKPIPTGPFPDFFHAPLNPLLNAIPLKLVQPYWKLSPIDVIYIGDRVIAMLGVLFFLGALAIWYAVAMRVFNKATATLGCAILLTTDLLWQFSISGLPQMLTLLLFGGCIWLCIRSSEKLSRTHNLSYLAGSGLCMGLMILTHGTTAWILPGWVLLVAVVGENYRKHALIFSFAATLLVVLPWLARNYSVSGNPLGLAGYELVTPAGSAETGYMRDLYNPPTVSFEKLFVRFQENLSKQTESLFALLGTNLAAISFFLSLLHRFNSSQANRYSRPVLLMWLGAFFGMILTGASSPLSPSNIHILFLPLFIFYGSAFLSDLFDKFTFQPGRLHRAFPAILVFLCGIPMWNTLLANKPPIQWPPYVPPFIAILGEWYEKEEIIASDMPWAVAWYAQRRSLLLPQTIKDFNRISDYRALGDAITGLYLTPLTGNRKLFTEIYKGPYTDWVLQITRPPVVTGFPLPVFTPLPIDGECILFADHDRWSRRE